MRVATIRRTMRIITFAIASTTLMSCLVTDSIDNTQPRNYPSSVVSTPDAVYPLNKIVQVIRDEVSEDLEFDIIIRDANVKTRLQTQVFIIRTDDTPIFQQLNNSIPPTMTESVERSTTIRIPFGVLVSDGCLKLEVLVSQEFESVRVPVDEGDVHSAVWWIAVSSSGGDAIDIRGCTQ